MKKARWLFPLLLTISSTIFGLLVAELLGILIAPLFSTEVRAILTSLLLVGGLTVITLVSVAFFSQQVETREKKWLEIEHRLGIPAEIDFESIAIGEGKFYRRLADYVSEASENDEIIVVANYGPRYGAENPRETEHYKLAREAYSQALLTKARQTGVVYRRVVCLSETSKQRKIKPGKVKQWLVDHCKEMLEIRKVKPSKVSLKKGTVTFGTDLFVIKDKIAVVTLEVRDPETRHMHTDGTLTFHNPPNGDIVRQLYELCMIVESQSIPVEKVPEE